MIRVGFFFLIFLVIGCGKDDSSQQNGIEDVQPRVLKDMKTIVFPRSSPQLKLFNAQEAKNLKIDIDFEAPVTVIGKAQKMRGNGLPPIILFASSNLTDTYSEYIQNLLKIKIAKKNLTRTKDLYKHGAATGKELNDISEELYNVESTLAEHEAKLRAEGFNPEDMHKAKTGTLWLIADLPETELNILTKKMKCTLDFPGYPGERFEAVAETLADVLNVETRKARVRLTMVDKKNKIKPGMFGKAHFVIKENGLMVPKNSIFSTNAKYYVFIKTNNNQFEKREVKISTEGEEYIEIHEGVKEGEFVVDENVMLLKGILFGI